MDSSPHPYAKRIHWQSELWLCCAGLIQLGLLYINPPRVSFFSFKKHLAAAFTPVYLYMLVTQFELQQFGFRGLVGGAGGHLLQEHFFFF